MLRVRPKAMTVAVIVAGLLPIFSARAPDRGHEPHRGADDRRHDHRAAAVVVRDSGDLSAVERTRPGHTCGRRRRPKSRHRKARPSDRHLARRVSVQRAPWTKTIGGSWISGSLPGWKSAGSTRHRRFRRGDPRAFEPDVVAGRAAGALDGWRDDADGALALAIVLDQFPLNMYRGQARSFATLPQAIAVTRHAVAPGPSPPAGNEPRGLSTCR